MTMTRFPLHLLLITLLLAVSLSACGNADPDDPAPTTTGEGPTATITPLPVAQGTPTAPSGASETPTTTTLTIWWPETLAPLGRSDVTDLLNEQFAAFNAAEDDAVEIVFRRKRAGTETGAILPTLRTAAPVAPGAMPDLTLLRREDLVSAVDGGLIQPLEGFISSSVIADLYNSSLELGRVDGQLYGLPYVMDALLMLYIDDPTSTADDAHLSFDELLAGELAFTIPGARPTGLNSTVLFQYFAAGGTLVSSTGEAGVDADALRSVLSFYEAAYEAGQIDETVLDYTTTGAYLDAIRSGDITNAIVRSDEYIRLREETGIDFYAGSIPTLSGEPGTLVNGWMWVMVANAPQQQAVAARFIDWMMQVERQRSFAEMIYLLPSQELAVRTMDRRLIDPTLFDALLSTAQVIESDVASGNIARTIQNAFVNVITGSMNAEAAAAEVIALAEE